VEAGRGGWRALDALTRLVTWPVLQYLTSDITPYYFFPLSHDIAQAYPHLAIPVLCRNFQTADRIILPLTKTVRTSHVMAKCRGIS
jgi:hypothetical protein